MLVENHRDDDMQCFSEGRTSHNKLIKIIGKALPIGAIVQTKITHNEGGALMGEFIRELSLKEALEFNIRAANAK